MSNLVSSQWLADHLKEVAILDASWHLPSAGRNAIVEFEQAHIPGAQFFNIDEISDQTSNLPHMLPSGAGFESAVRALGINTDSHVVVYDSVGLFSAARCWWMFKVFGHKSVSVLDGGLKKWRAESRALEAGPAQWIAPGNFTSGFHEAMVAKLAEVAGGRAQIVDVRSPSRFRGEEAEPRPGVRPGHMPGALNLHYARLLEVDGTLKSKAALASAFAEANVDINRPIITSCGSGVTAAIATLALTEIGANAHKLYDGSWAEWGSSNQEVKLG